MRRLRLLLAVAYPFLVLVGLRVAEPRWLALGLGLLLALRVATRWRAVPREAWRRLLVPVLLVGSVIAGTAASNDPRLLLFVPALVNAALLVSFARTLFAGPPLVETFARLRVPDLPEDEVRYCRGVTAVWSLFFAGNALVSLWLAVAGDVWRWTLYTGFLAYLLVGLLFSAEFVVRAWRFGRYEGTLVEPLFRRLFQHGRPT